MVVLEGHNMLGVNSPNQYLSPDYLSPLPTTLDAKKSPLALLVQTCSQIGADGPTPKSLLHPSPLSSSDSNSSLSSSSSTSGIGQKRKASTSSDSGHGGSLKSLGGISSNDSSNDSSRPRSSGSTSSTCSSAKQPRLSSEHSGKVSVSPKHSYHHNNNNNEVISHGHSDHKIRKLSGQSGSPENSSEKQKRSSPPSSVIVPQGKHSSSSTTSISSSGGTRSPSHHNNHQNITIAHDSPKETHSSSNTATTKSSKSSESSSKSSKENSSPKPPTSSSSHPHDQGTSPIIRSGLDVLQGKDLPKFGAFGYPPNFDPNNPAFRLPFLGQHHAAAAAHLLGYPSGAHAMPPTAPGSHYFGYSRVKSASGDVCKDPYCTGCAAPPSSNAFMAAVAGLNPSTNGAIPCFPGYNCHPSLLNHPFIANMHQQQVRAIQNEHVCSWVVGDSFCGKRFRSSEELLQHLRTHTNATAAAASTSGLPNPPPPPPHPHPSFNALLNSSAMAAMQTALHRTPGYPTPPLYHSGMFPPPPPLHTLVPSPAGNTGSSAATAAALSSYYQRFGPYMHP